jgi:hypothetical protein
LILSTPGGKECSSDHCNPEPTAETVPSIGI